MKRKIIQINEEKCNGCGNCINICAEAALELVDGKAKVVKDFYCDGMGACLDVCPVDALKIVEADVAEYDPEKTQEHVKAIRGEEAAKKVHGIAKDDNLACGCPGTTLREIELDDSKEKSDLEITSQLTQWPVQLNLLGPGAPFFDDSDLLICADCVPFAEPNLHQVLLKGRSVVIGCPKFDDSQTHINKLSEIFKSHNIKSITVAIMEVPCCNGLLTVVEEALKLSGKDIPMETKIVKIQK